MKKIIVLCCLLVCFSTFASSRDQFRVKITNTLATDCKLSDEYILFGHVSDHTSIPTVIPSNKTKTFLMRSGPRYQGGVYKDKSFVLTYVCDSEQEVTLYAAANNHDMDAKALNVKNIRATFESYIPWFSHSELYWTLTY